MASDPAFAYLAEGKLYLKRDGAAPRLIDSPFVQSMLDRVARDRQRNDWKSEGLGWQFGAPRMLGLRGSGQPPPEVRRVQYTGVARGAMPNELLYALDTDHVGGLFSFDVVDSHERRLFHRNQFRARDLSRNPRDGTLALSLLQTDGSANIATIAAEGKGLRELTEGDSRDEAPAWSADGRMLVFQSAGIGRDSHGVPRGLGPYAVQQLDLERGELTTLVEDDRFDYLTPRLAPDGSLFCIRRPYQPHEPISPLKVAADVLLFPYRVARATVQFLNFFSMMFARKPLLTAGGPPKEGPDARYLMLWGTMIDTEKALNRSRKLGGSSLVPSSWALVRRDDRGAEETIATAVLAFDLCPNGLLFTNGTTVSYRSPAGQVTQLTTGRLIERVVALD
ncbi:MAG TPA: hypothetical protein VGI81_13245 [Tepidisphaeraceae bacterium]|jgi:hypothetical protein